MHAVSLTGLADRSHLGGPGADLDTHVTDVVQALRFAEATDIVLVGHSYAGTVVAAAADRAPELVGTVVYVDTAALLGAAGDMDDDTWERLQRFATPHPFASYTQPVTYSGNERRHRRVGIGCRDAWQILAFARSEPGNPMLSDLLATDCSHGEASEPSSRSRTRTCGRATSCRGVSPPGGGLVTACRTSGPRRAVSRRAGQGSPTGSRSAPPHSW